ncbi:MAG TPA: ribonuclease P protein component [Xanthobacteraceae bacterium]|nr:ribonuclease P protein component [Xanthobacteraceae bacterium]
MERLRQREDFLAAAKGLRVPTRAFVVQARRRADTGPPRFGFTASRKIGTAVERNRIRRRLRDVVRRTDAAELAAGHDYVLVARRDAMNLPFDRLMDDFRRAVRRLAAQRDGKSAGGKRHGIRRDRNGTTGRVGAGEGD